MPRLPRVLLAALAVLSVLAIGGPAQAQGQTGPLIGPGEINFPTVSGLLQARVKGGCRSDAAIRRIKRTGKVQCSKPFEAVNQLRTSDGLTGGGSGKVALGVDSTVLQNRVAGTCAGRGAVQSVKQDGTVTCLNTGAGEGSVTSVGSGFGLSGGPITESGTLAADPAVLQRRITGACAPGRALRAVDQEGTVGCDPFVGSVTAGSGLTGGTITDTGTIAVDPTAVQSRITGTCAGTQALQIVDQGGTVTCSPTLQSRITGSCTANNAIQGVAADGSVTCRSLVTGVTAGTGLTGGTITDSGTIAVDPTAVQSRVTGTCASNRAVQGVNQNGTVACSDELVASTRVLTPDVSQIPAGQQATVLTVNGLSVVNDCRDGSNGKVLIRASPTNNVNAVTSDDGSSSVNGGTLQGALAAPTNELVMLSTPVSTVTRGDGDMVTIGGPDNNDTTHVSAYIVRSGGSCQVAATAIAG